VIKEDGGKTAVQVRQRGAEEKAGEEVRTEDLEEVINE